MTDYLNSVDTFTSAYVDDDGDDIAKVILMDRNSGSYLSDALDNVSATVVLIFSPENVSYVTSDSDLINSTAKNEVGYRDQLSIIIPISICYFIIFIAGILGNMIICVVIAKNKTMHTATNYYLFNLAVSDFLVLVVGMPFDFMNIWLPDSYPFDEVVCILQGLLTETSTNATILTITSFTCERYIAICHPFRSHTMSKLSRVVKFIMAIWFLAFALAMPQAFQFGVVQLNGGHYCTVKNQFIEHAFEISSFIFFIVPMTVICVLYVLIGLKLRQSKLLYGKKMKNCDSQRCIKGQSRVIRMLVAVVATFFFCWAPFHAQRIMAVYGKIMNKSFSSDDVFMRVYITLTYTSGISYFLSTCVNPFLYNIMSHKFRNASKLTLVVHCLSRTPSTKKSKMGSNYSALSLKFGALESGRHMTTFNHSPLMIPPTQKTSEILQINGARNIDEIRTFACRGDGLSPFLMDHPYQPTVKSNASYCEPVNFSCSQHTASTTLSRDNSLDSSVKRSSLKKVRMMPCEKMEKREIVKESFAQRLKKCTQKVLTFKSDVHESTTADKKKTIIKKASNESIRSGNTISNSSLKEIDEEEFTSSELAQKMFEVNKEIRHLATHTS